MKIKIGAGSFYSLDGLEWQYNVLPSICIIKVFGEIEICFGWLFGCMFFRIKQE